MPGPVETPKHLLEEAERGKSEVAPFIVLGGVTLVVAIAVAVLLTITLLIYFLV